jgi:DNA-binding GntR family transcriptional regulator
VSQVTTNEIRFHRYPSLQAVLALPREDERSLVEKAADEILARIITGKFTPGTRLKCTQLATLLGMSRTPVAGALARLVDDGVLVQSFNHMAVVGPNASNWLVQVHELRQLIEPQAAALAAGRFSAEALDDLHMLMRDAKPTREGGWQAAAIQFDFAIHLSIGEFCGNQLLATAIRKCWSFKRLSYDLSNGCRHSLRREYAEHVSILEAIAGGKSSQAKSRMVKHLRTAADTRSDSSIV